MVTSYQVMSIYPQKGSRISLDGHGHEQRSKIDFSARWSTLSKKEILLLSSNFAACLAPPDLSSEKSRESGREIKSD